MNLLKLSRLICVALFAGYAAMDAAYAVEDHWPGVGALHGGKGYVATPMGQVHYRDQGPSNAPIPMLLLHQTPMFMIEFAAVQNELTKRGIRSIALDTPGTGMSDRPPGMPTIEQFADNLIPVLDRLGVKRVLVAGHHTGASIATAFAARHPDRTAGVIIHGVGLFSPEEMKKRGGVKGGAWDRTPREDGAQFHGPFDFRRGAAKKFGIVQSPEDLATVTWMAVGLFLQGDDIGHPAAYAYDLKSDLTQIKSPGIIMSDKLDSIYANTVEASRARPDFKYIQFSNENHGAMMYQSSRWADIAVEFLNSLK